MKKEKQIEENVMGKPQQPSEVHVGKTIHSILGGSILTKEKAVGFFPYLIFLACIAIVYISNIYYAEKTIRETNKIKRELKELRYEYITSKSELMFCSKQSEVAKRLENTGIKEATTPPFKIFIIDNEQSKESKH